MALILIAVLAIREARTTQFVHGEELAWLLAYLIPLVISVFSLVLALAHVLRGRRHLVLAWLPVFGALAAAGWLILYLFFDAFRW